MKWTIAAAGFSIFPLYCAPKPPDWYSHQDRSIKMPRFDATTKIDLVIDGATLQAVRVAADDFLPPSSQTRQCSDGQVAHRYEVSRQGDIIFVRISEDPAACGGQGYSLDGAGRYAIHKDGRILRRVLDGDGQGSEEPDDAGQPLDAGTPGGAAMPDAGTP